MGIGKSKQKKQQQQQQQQQRNAPPPRTNDNDAAILRLKKQRDEILRYQKRIEMAIQKELTAARGCMQKGEKEKAKRVLLQKRRHQEILDRSHGHLTNILSLIDRTEETQMAAKITEALQVGTAVLENMKKEMGNVEAIMDQARDAMEWADSVTGAMSEPLTAEDNEEFDEILQQWEQQDLANQLKQVNVPEGGEPAKVKVPAKVSVSEEAAEEGEEEEEDDQRQPIAA